MRILMVLTYYRPHTSGLTIYVERLSKALVTQGHRVTVLTSRFDQSTPVEETVDGVTIIRAPVAVRISKGVIMPTFGLKALRLIKEHDVVHLHLPQFDAAVVAFLARINGVPNVITYHCDLDLPKGLFNRIANFSIHVMNRLAASFTNRFVAYTEDFAQNSPFLKAHANKLTVISPPVTLPAASESDKESFAENHDLADYYPVIGMATRFATEKGVEVLLNALPQVSGPFPNFKVLYAGTYQHVMGEEDYFDRLYPIIREYEQKGQWTFLGNLTPSEMAVLYPNLDMLVVPSLNSTESFGLVQIEAMINGTPCIASNLPGVRQPVIRHEMGEVIPIGDHNALARAIIDIANNPGDYIKDPEPIRERYEPVVIAKKYEQVYRALIDETS